MNEYYLFVLENKYATFTGRASRREYWMFYLFQIFFAIVAVVLDNLLDTTILGMGYGLIYIVFIFATFLPALAVSVRRLHDIGKSGWMYLVILIPLVGPIWLLVLFATDGDSSSNIYGPSLKQMFCGQCGVLNDRSASFCKECGAALGGSINRGIQDQVS